MSRNNSSHWQKLNTLPNSVIEKAIGERLNPMQYADTATYQYQMMCVSKTNTELSLIYFIIFPENIALKKPAYQSSTDEDDVTRNAAGSAVDGNLANNWEGGDPCSHTAEDPEAWLAVDLQGTYIHTRLCHIDQQEWRIWYSTNTNVCGSTYQSNLQASNTNRFSKNTTTACSHNTKVVVTLFIVHQHKRCGPPLHSLYSGLHSISSCVLNFEFK